MRLRDLSRERGLEVGVSHSLLFDPQIKSALEKVRSGALGDLISVDILRSSLYPPYAGGPLPPQYRTAGYPFRDLGIHGLYVIEAFLGPIEHVDASWRSGSGDGNLAFNDWRAVARCQQGDGPDPALVRRAAAAAPDHPAGHQGRDAPRSVPDVPGVAQAGAAAQARRAHRQRAHRFAPAADRRAPQRHRVRAQAAAPVPRRAGADHRVLRGAEGRPAPARDRRGRDQRREVDRGGGARRRRRRHRARGALSALGPGPVPGDRRVGRPRLGAGRSPARRGAADPRHGAPAARPPRGQARRRRVRARRSRRPRGGRSRRARRARGVPRRRGDEGQLARAPGRHHRGDAQRARRVPQARRDQAGARQLAVGDRLGRRRGERDRRRGDALRGPRRGARLLHARQARGREAGVGRGCAWPAGGDPAPGPDLRPPHPADDRRDRAARRRSLSGAGRRRDAAAAGLHRRRRRRADAGGQEQPAQRRDDPDRRPRALDAEPGAGRDVRPVGAHRAGAAHGGLRHGPRLGADAGPARQEVAACRATACARRWRCAASRACAPNRCWAGSRASACAMGSGAYERARRRARLAPSWSPLPRTGEGPGLRRPRAPSPRRRSPATRSTPATRFRTGSPTPAHRDPRAPGS